MTATSVVNPTPSFAPFTSDLALADVLDIFKQNLLANFNCHHLAVIQSFNSANQTVTANINYTRTVYNLQGNTKTGQVAQVLLAQQINYPLLVDVPVIVLGGGGCHLTFPIKQGDQALILFNDRSIDSWFQNGQIGNLSSPRTHSFSDGIALVGLNSLNSSIPNYDTTRAVLQNGTTGVGVGASKVKIYNATGSLGVALQSLLTALSTFMTSCEASATDPVLAAAATTFAASTTTAISNIEALLE
jgi:hypothetical protein